MSDTNLCDICGAAHGVAPPRPLTRTTRTVPVACPICAGTGREPDSARLYGAIEAPCGVCKGARILYTTEVTDA